jgi:2-keto-4-pentenoate hydratase
VEAPVTVDPEHPRIRDAAERLHRAKVSRVPIAPLARSWRSLDEPAAYAVQRAGWSLVEGRIAGFKLGYTSAAMRAQMRVDTPNYGALFAETRVENGGTIDAATLIHPLVEPEIAIALGRDIDDGALSRERLFAAAEAVMPALEIVDTRYERYEFTAVDNIADNSSAARFVLGEPRRPSQVGDLRRLTGTLGRDDRVVARGTGADVMGDPFAALAWFLARAIRDGLSVPAGTIVLTGGMTAAQPAGAGSAFVADFGELGSVRCLFR